MIFVCSTCAETFIRWRDVLTPEDCAAYEAKARAELGENRARGLAGGPGGAQARWDAGLT